MVTGRRLEPLLEVFPQLTMFDLVVVENGGLLYWPETKEELLLCEPPPANFVETLMRRGVPDIEIGRAIVATWTPHETEVLETIRDLALELQIIFNKGAVMVLPTGVNKASGLKAALEQLHLSPRNTVGVGDAENDEAFLKLCELSAAVDNALTPVKERVDIVLSKPRGEGVVELIDRLIANELHEYRGRAERSLLLGTNLEDGDVRLPVYNSRVLIIGSPASGKSNLALSLLEQLAHTGYQTVIIDPEGDYQELASAVVLGTVKRPPSVEEAVRIAEESTQNCVATLFGLDHDEQPVVCSKLLRALLELRSRFWRPHWILIDEAHYVAPADWVPANDLNVEELRGAVWITAFPDRLSNVVVRNITLFIAMGDDPEGTLRRSAELVDEEVSIPPRPDDWNEFHVLGWWRQTGITKWFRRVRPAGEHVRHQHNYLEGNLEERYRFYFRGSRGTLNLPAQNLKIFMQIGDGVDDETWLHHLRAGDYSTWFREVIVDDELATATMRIEQDMSLSPYESRQQIGALIRERYASESC